MGFLDNVTEMVGLYLNPPERAIAFSTDERVRAPTWERGELGAIASLRRHSQGAEFRAFLQVVKRANRRVRSGFAVRFVSVFVRVTDCLAPSSGRRRLRTSGIRFGGPDTMLN